MCKAKKWNSFQNTWWTPQTINQKQTVQSTEKNTLNNDSYSKKHNLQSKVNLNLFLFSFANYNILFLMDSDYFLGSSYISS